MARSFNKILQGLIEEYNARARGDGNMDIVRDLHDELGEWIEEQNNDRE